MSRVPLVDPSTTDGQRRASLDRIGVAFGTVPAMFRAVANSPAALQSMWGAFGAFSTGALGAALSEQIAVAVADRSKCHYCLAAHTALGLKAGLSKQQMRAAQGTDADDPRVRALLTFAVELVDRRGAVEADDIQRLRDHGWSDAEIVETIAQVALNLFTNYISIALDVPVDFPAVPLTSESHAVAS